MSKLAALLLPLLLLACRPPDMAGRKPAPTPPLRPGPTQLQIEVITPPEIAVSEALQNDLLSELKIHLASWNPVEVPAGTPRTATEPRLRVRVRNYQPKPAGSPFAAIGLPGGLGMSAGWSVVNSTSLISAKAGSSLANVIGFGTAVTGLTALVIGIALESRKAYLDRKRGYALHTFKAEVRIIWPVGGGLREEKEVYRALDLGSAARPMSAQEAADPAQVRREMMRAFAIRIREDIGTQTGWGRPDED